MTKKPKNVRELPCKLTMPETIERTKEMVSLMNTRDKEEEALKLAKALHHRRVKDELDPKIKALQTSIANGQEIRGVEIVVKKNFKTKSIETIRMDTKEVISTHAMTEADKQGDLAIAPTSLGNSGQPKGSPKHPNA